MVAQIQILRVYDDLGHPGGELCLVFGLLPAFQPGRRRDSFTIYGKLAVDDSLCFCGQYCLLYLLRPLPEFVAVLQPARVVSSIEGCDGCFRIDHRGCLLIDIVDIPRASL